MISDLIRWEGVALLSSLFWGMVYACIYDCIRIFRRVFKHRKLWLLVIEDIIFWIYVGINVFCITFQLNDGVIRGFSLIGYLVGAVVYRYTLGRLILKYVTKVILFILKPLKKAFQFIRIKASKLVHAWNLKRAKNKAEAKKKKEEAEAKKKQEQAEAEKKLKEAAKSSNQIEQDDTQNHKKQKRKQIQKQNHKHKNKPNHSYDQ